MNNEIHIDFLGHATLALRCAGLTVLFDPHLNSSYRHNLFGYFPQRVVEIDSLVDAVDIVVLSHSHRDHFDPPSLRFFARETTFIIPHDCRIQHALAALGFENVFVVRDWSRIELSRGFTVTVTPSTYRVPEHGFLIQMNGLSVWNLVDTHVTEEWCNRVLTILGGSVDYLLLPTQPLIEGNSTSVVGPYATSARVRETAEIVDIVKPAYVIPFADGHYCLGRAAWLNHHWMPFERKQKWDAIDQATYKPQVLDCDAGDALSISMEGGAYRHRAAASMYAKQTGGQDRRPPFFPAATMEPSASYKNLDIGSLSKAFDSLLSPSVLNEVSSRLARFELNGESTGYMFALLDTDAKKVIERSVLWDGAQLRANSNQSQACYEVVCGAAEFIDLYESRMEFSAALIGGFLRESREVATINNRQAVFRSLADLANSAGPYSISGIFILNQLLLVERDRMLLEVTKALEGSSLQQIGAIDSERLWNRRFTIRTVENACDRFVRCLIQEFLEYKVPYFDWSGVRDWRGRRVFFGFMDGKQWDVPNGVQCVLVPTNLAGPQSVFGCGVGAAQPLAATFRDNVRRFKEVTTNICLGLECEASIPLWRMVDLFPAVDESLVQLIADRIQLDPGVIELAKTEKPWWLGYPPISTPGDEVVLTVRFGDGLVLRGVVNSRADSLLSFKNQLSFVAATGAVNMGCIERLVEGDIRISWIQPESRWHTSGVESWDQITHVLSTIVGHLL